VRLVSYQRDLGVWMFRGVRREWFLLAIALKLNAVFVPFVFFLFFLFESYDYCLWVQNPTCSLRYGIEKTPNYPWEKANPPSSSGMEPTAHLAPNKRPSTS